MRKGDLVPEVIEGRLPQGPDEMALGSRAARDLDVDVGSLLTLRGPEGDQELRVSGIAILPGVEEAGLLGQIGVVTAQGMARLAPDEEMSSAMIGLAPGADRDDIEAIVEPFGVGAGRFDTPTEIVNLRRIDGTPYLVAGIVGLLAVLSIGHLVVTSARRHRFDLAVLRAFGATAAGWAVSSIGRPPPSPPSPSCWLSLSAWPSGRRSTARTPRGSAPVPTRPSRLVGWRWWRSACSWSPTWRWSARPGR